MSKKVFGMMAVLFTLGSLAAILLSFTAQFAYPLIEENRRIALQKAILEVLPQATNYKILNEADKIYIGLNEHGDKVGLAFVAEGGGYQGIIKLMVGISQDWQQLSAIQVLESLETPGLGAKIASLEFTEQFVSLKVEPEIEYILNKPAQKANQIQAITGATISSRAVVKILNKTIHQVRSRIKKNGG